jgi:hydrogenase nickel incorporation protein HypA/HybF
MHEVALASSLVELAREEAARAGASRVDKLIVEIGALSHVDGHALTFAFDSARMGGVTDRAVLDIVETPGKAWCMTCDAVVEIARRGQDCPACGGARLMVQGGEEMKLTAMEIV